MNRLPFRPQRGSLSGSFDRGAGFAGARGLGRPGRMEYLTGGYSGNAEKRSDGG